MLRIRRTKRAARRRKGQIIHMKRLRSWYETGYGDEILTWYWLKSTGKPCSCEGCRNVRRSGWFKKGQRLTNQEKRSDISHAEQLREYYDAKDVSA